MKFNATSIDFITHTECIISSSKSWYFNSKSTRHMGKDEITRGNRAKGITKSSVKLVNIGK